MRKSRVNRRKSERGSAAVETALILSAIAFMIPALFDLSDLISASQKLSGGLRAGAEYGFSQYENTSVIQDIVRNASGLTPSASVTVVTTAPFCECDGVSATCGSLCADGDAAAAFVTITATYPVDLNYGYLGNPYNLSRETTVRVY